MTAECILLKHEKGTRTKTLNTRQSIRQSELSSLMHQKPTFSIYISQSVAAAWSCVEDWFNYHKQITQYHQLFLTMIQRPRNPALSHCWNNLPWFCKRWGLTNHIVHWPLAAHSFVQTYSSQHSLPEIASYIFNNHSGALNCSNRHDSLHMCHSTLHAVQLYLKTTYKYHNTSVFHIKDSSEPLEFA